MCDGIVKYYYQPIGIIVAETQYIADRASKLVTVKYSNVTKPVVDIKEAKMDSSRNTLYAAVDATNPGTDIYKTISGSNTFYGQYHFPMETLVCVVKPTEEGLEVHTATQWLDGTQVMISRALNLDANRYVFCNYCTIIIKTILFNQIPEIDIKSERLNLIML